MNFFKFDLLFALSSSSHVNWEKFSHKNISTIAFYYLLVSVVDLLRKMNESIFVINCLLGNQINGLYELNNNNKNVHYLVLLICPIISTNKFLLFYIVSLFTKRSLPTFWRQNLWQSKKKISYSTKKNLQVNLLQVRKFYRFS